MFAGSLGVERSPAPKQGAAAREGTFNLYDDNRFNIRTILDLLQGRHYLGWTD